KELFGKRIHFGGTGINITAAAAQAIGMVMHELATNAHKYGALSSGGGRVVISWNIEAPNRGQPRFTMSWTESDGPPVAIPLRRGFGSTVLDTLAKMSLSADVELDYAASGLVWRLTCPADTILEPSTARTQQSSGSENSRTTVLNPRILVVEDEA